MSRKQRYFIFGIGFLIGCLILSISLKGKNNSKAVQEAVDAAHGYFLPSRMLLGQDFVAKMPLQGSDNLLEMVDGPIHSSTNQFERILISKEAFGGETVYWRFREIIWKDPSSARIRLVSRQKMRADRLYVRLKRDYIPQDKAFKTFFTQNPSFTLLKLELTASGKILATIGIKPTHKDFLEALHTLEQAPWGEAAFPHYEYRFE